MKIRTIISAFLFISAISLYAQETEDASTDSACTFASNMYVEFGIGTQILLSSDASNLSFMDRQTFAPSITFGKWFTPYFGLRTQLRGYSLNGYSTANGIYLADPISGNTMYGNNDPVRNEVEIYPDGSYRHYVRYFNWHVDAIFSLKSVLKMDESKWDVLPAVGLGYMHVFDYKGIPSANLLTTHYSLMGKYRINETFDVNMELQSVLMPDKFEGRLTGRSVEGIMSLNVGLTYRFGKQGLKKKVLRGETKTRIEYKYKTKVETVFEVVKQIDTVYVLKETPYTKAKSIIATINLKFQFDSVKQVDNSQNDKLRALAQIMIENPDMSLLITGHTCDKASHAYNVTVGQERAEVIKKQLQKYGVADSQMRIESKAFDEPLVPNTNEANRSLNRRVELAILS